MPTSFLPESEASAEPPDLRCRSPPNVSRGASDYSEIRLSAVQLAPQALRRTPALLPFWLLALTGFNGGSARGINGAGHVVGCSLVCQGQACMEGRAFLYRNGTLTELKVGEYSCATAINDAEQVAGYSNTSGFFWSNGTLTNINGFGDFSEIEPRAINQAGEVAGALWETVPSAECYTSPYPPCHFVTTGYPFRWPNGSLITLYESLDATASSINNFGAVAGTFSRDGRSQAFLTMSSGIFVELGALDGRNSSSASGINNSGDAVGTSYSCEGDCVRIGRHSYTRMASWSTSMTG